MTAITAKDIKYAALATRTSQCPLNPQWSRGSWIGRGCPTYNHHNGKLYIIIKYFVSELTNFADSMGPRERVCQFVFQYTMRTCSCHIPYHISYIPYPISQIISFQPPITDTQSPGRVCVYDAKLWLILNMLDIYSVNKKRLLYFIFVFFGLANLHSFVSLFSKF